MLVVVGSRNKSKVVGVERAYKFFSLDVEVVGVEVPSQVPPQPLGIETIFKGSLNRALKSLEVVGSADHGVGVEAGLFRVGDRWFDVHVAVIADRYGHITYGLSPAFEVPYVFVDEILRGSARELEVVVDKYFKTKDIGEYGGFIKILSNGKVLREDLTFNAVVMALIPRLNSELYNLRSC
jgi:inosine/xanthosine triphosphatase